MDTLLVAHTGQTQVSFSANKTGLLKLKVAGEEKCNESWRCYNV